jgi:hypothetical protein
MKKRYRFRWRFFYGPQPHPLNGEVEKTLLIRVLRPILRFIQDLLGIPVGH